MLPEGNRESTHIPGVVDSRLLRYCQSHSHSQCSYDFTFRYSITTEPGFSPICKFSERSSAPLIRFGADRS